MSNELVSIMHTLLSGTRFRIVKRRRMMRKRKSPRSGAQYVKYKEQARALVLERVSFWNTHYQLPFGRIAIRNQKTRWGSCSSKGNLNFSYKLALLPIHLVDYIVVHELCHLKEFNHGSRFWILVAQTIPDYQIRRVELRKQVIQSCVSG